MLLTILLAAAALAPDYGAGPHPMLFREPTLSKTTIVFCFAGDLWAVPRSGGSARRLTSSLGIETAPHFSPDGTMLAFSATHEGNEDVYVMPIVGGEARRLTFHPSPETVVGWSPDGKKIIFASSRLSNTDLPRLFTLPVTGGMPFPLPLPSGSTASYDADGSRLAYQPGFQWQDAWKRYRGGQTSAIWIAQMSDSHVKEIPRNNWNDKDPIWIGGKIFYLSDRTGPFGMYCYDTSTGDEKACIPGEGFDLKSIGGGADGIVYEQLGSLGIYDPQTGESHRVRIDVHSDFTAVRPTYKSLARSIANIGISPTGSRVLLEARGRIFTAPAAKGDIHDLTQKDGVAERFPAWSPDGETIAFLSDESGEYKLVLKDASSGAEKSLSLGDSPTYYYRPIWSPDSTKLAYTDCRDNLWYIDVASGKNVKVDSTTYFALTRPIRPSWSPDSKWIAYDRDLPSYQDAIFLFSLDAGKSTQITDGLSDARFPIFDHSGKYLYFVAGTDAGGSTAWLDLSSYNYLNRVSAGYCVVLKKDSPNPLEPESDEEPSKDAKKPADDSKFRIDLDGIGQRVISLPMQQANYADLVPGPDDVFFAVAISPVSNVISNPTIAVTKFSMNDRTQSLFARNVNAIVATPDGSKLLLAQGPTLSIVPTAMPPQPGQGQLNLAGLSAKIDPRAEWRQMYHEVWRIERDFFYSPTYNGQNLAALEARYKPFLENITSRDDLNYLFTDMLGELSIGHMFISGGDIPDSEGEASGLLGADYNIENGRYRLSKVYSGENWNPGFRAPLTQPGVYAKPGEYVLAIDGRNLTSADNIDELLEGKAGKQVKVKLGPNPDGSGSREATVIPVPNELGLRNRAWEEDNRRKVDELSGGKLGYFHVPDTNIGGWLNFNRFYFTQLDKPGLVIDERFNHGGEVDTYMVEQMERHLNSMWMTRYGKDMSSPAAQNFGPKVLMINQYAGSGGDYFPWHFKHDHVGPLVGKRTWGGLVGILQYPPLVDGGSVTAPSIAFYNPNGTWDVENHGVDPDVEVDLDPYLWRQGHDTQLEKAVQVAMDLLSKTPLPNVKKPAYPDKSKIGG